MLSKRDRSPPLPQVVVITGASAGIGRAVARMFGARGAGVGLIARGRDGLEAARREPLRQVYSRPTSPSGLPPRSSSTGMPPIV